MTVPSTSDGKSVLFIFDGADPAICRCGELLMESGTRVQWVPDVYAAMAQLSMGNLPDRIIVDVRILDEAELQFLTLAPRYHPGLRVSIAQLEGTADRMAGIPGKHEIVPLIEIADEAMGIRSAATVETIDDAVIPDTDNGMMHDAAIDAIEPADAIADAGPAESHAFPPEPVANAAATDDRNADEFVDTASDDDAIWPTDADDEQVELENDEELPASLDATDFRGRLNKAAELRRLSTDGGPDTPTDGPSLHEAVRQRMAGAQAPSSRRIPPGARAPETAITPEEIDALLDRGGRGSAEKGVAE